MYTLIITVATKEPVVGFFIGIVLLMIVGFTNWYGNNKANCVKFLSTTIYNNGPLSEKLANGLFMVLTSMLLSLGGNFISSKPIVPFMIY